MYPEERLKLFYQAFGNSSEDSDFTSAVDNLIAKEKYAPLLAELSDAVDRARSERLQNDRRNAATAYDVLAAAAGRGSADPDLVKACLKLLTDYGLGKEKPTRQLTRAQFEEGCRYIADVAAHLERGKEKPAPTPPRKQWGSERRIGGTDE